MQARWLHTLSRGERSAFNRLTAVGFRLVEHGRELGRDQMFDTVRALSRRGTVVRWSVTRARVELDCSLAVMSYVNDGSVTTKGGPPERVRWLETAVLRRTRSGWRLQLATSQRVGEQDGARTG